MSKKYDNNMKFPKNVYKHVTDNTLIEIKAGIERKTFLNIWIVEVDSRLFVRSWNKSSKSWFTEFLKSEVGQIKYGNKIINVIGKKLHKNDNTNLLINEAYLKKYTQKENLEYAKEISQTEYSDYTIELLYNEK